MREVSERNEENSVSCATRNCTSCDLRKGGSTNYHTSVEEGPFFSLYGTDRNVPLDLILRVDQSQYANLKDYTSRLAVHWRKAWTAA